MAGVVTLNRPPEALVRARDTRRSGGSRVYVGLLTLTGLLVTAMVLGIIGVVLAKGAGAISWPFLSQPPTEGMTEGGIWPMIRGSLLLMAGTLVIVLPLSVLAGIFLAEYAGRSRWAHIARGLVTSLAGTPSIVYGLFGLAIFVLMLKLGVSLIAGWLTLTMMAVPVIVLGTEQALRAVPVSIVDGALALGLTRWQAIWRVSLPYAAPGIMTGIVLATGRAAGEAPPILLTAGIYYSTQTPALSMETLKTPVANLPYHLAEAYRQSSTIPQEIVWGTCLTLMALVLAINLGAILIRAQVRKKRAI